MSENEELKSAYYSGWVNAINYVIKHELFIEPEIIRCKDCKNYYPDEDGRGYHCERDSNVRFSVHKDFYCADAERRTDERLDIQTECD